MKYLENIIKEQGKILPGNILKVDCFLNHQVNVNVIDEIGKEFARLFSDTKPDKILTIETSGVPISYATSMNMDKQNVVYAKKGTHLNQSKNVYQCKEKSYTKDLEYVIQVSKEYLKPKEKILIIDDFLANGEALNSLISICKQADAEIVGIGIVIAKMYQPGYERIKKMFNRIEVLAKVKSMSDDGKIEFED